MVAPLSDVPQEGSSVFSLISLIKLHLASLPLASSYSRVAVSSIFWAQNIYFSAQTRGAPLNCRRLEMATYSGVFCFYTWMRFAREGKAVALQYHEQGSTDNKVCGGFAVVRSLSVDETNKARQEYVKKSKRGACEQKAATVLPNRTAAT